MVGLVGVLFGLVAGRLSLGWLTAWLVGGLDGWGMCIVVVCVGLCGHGAVHAWCVFAECGAECGAVSSRCSVGSVCAVRVVCVVRLLVGC